MNRRVVETAAAVATFLYYLFGVAPGCEWLDSGELTTAGFTLGVSHPPGQPTYTLLAKLATFLPFGEVAFRVNLLSAMAAAVAVAGTIALAHALIDKEDDVTLIGALGAAVLVALSPTLLEQGLRAEVYAPAAAATTWAAALGIGFLRRAHGDARGALGASLLLALTAGIHPLVAAVVAAPLAVAILARRRWRLVPAIAGAGALGLLVQAYLPLRAAAGHALLVWGDPSSWHRFVDVILAHDYHGNFGAGGFLERLGGHVLVLGEGTGLAIIAVGGAGLLFGALTGLRGALTLCAASVLLVAAPAAQRIFYPENPDIHGYLLPALPLLAAGIAALVVAAARAHRAGPILVLLPTLLLVSAGPHRHVDGGERRHDDALALHDALLGAMPAGPAIFMASSDHAFFTATYERLVAGARPDVAIVNDALLRSSWFLRMLKRELPALWIPYLDDGGRIDGLAPRLVGENLRAGRPVWGERPLPELPTLPVGMAYAYGVTGAAPRATPPRVFHGELGRRIGRDAGLIRADWERRHDRWRDAAVAAGVLDQVSDPGALDRIPPGTHSLLDAIPGLTPVFIFGDWQADLVVRDLRVAAGLSEGPAPAPDAPIEIRVFHALVSHDIPADDESALVLASVDGNRGDLDEAARVLDAVLARGESPRAWAARGLVHAKKGELAAAAEAFRKSLALDPDQPEVQAMLRKAEASP